MDSYKNDTDPYTDQQSRDLSPSTVDQQTSDTSLAVTSGLASHSDLMRQLNDEREKVNRLQEENLELQARDVQQRKRVTELQNRAAQVAYQLRKLRADLIQVSFEEDGVLLAPSSLTSRTGAKESRGSTSDLGAEEISVPGAEERMTHSAIAVNPNNPTVSEAPPTMNLPPLKSPRICTNASSSFVCCLIIKNNTTPSSRTEQENSSLPNSRWKRLKRRFQMHTSDRRNPQDVSMASEGREYIGEIGTTSRTSGISGDVREDKSSERVVARRCQQDRSLKRNVQLKE